MLNVFTLFFCWFYVLIGIWFSTKVKHAVCQTKGALRFWRFSFGKHFNCGGHGFGSLQVLSSTSVCSLVHVPHLVHQENGLNLLTSCAPAN